MLKDKRAKRGRITKAKTRREPQTFFPKQCSHTEGVLTVGAMARCSFEVVSSVSSQFPVNFRIEWLLWNVHVYFDCAGSHKTDVAVEAYGISPVNSHAKWLLWNVHVHFDCAGSHSTGAAAGASGMFPVNFRIKWLLWHVHVQNECPRVRHFSYKFLHQIALMACHMSMCISTALARTKRGISYTEILPRDRL